MDTPPISYPQLFSFQVSYVSDSGHSRNSTVPPEDKKGQYRQGFLEVDFDMEALFIHDRDRIFMSQSFSALRNHVDAECLDDCSICIKFDSEQWKITSQNIAEKTCIQHLLECIVNGTQIEEALQIGKEKGIIGLDINIQKHGHILRRAANHDKVEERYLILVPGKLLLFKSFEIIGKHVRYATSLLGASVRTLPEEQEFQVSAPGSKTMCLISSNSEDYYAWVEAVETSIEYTKHAARAAGMATLPTKKQRRSRGSKVHRVQWDNDILNQQAQLLDRGEHTRIDAEVAQLNQQAVSPSRDDNSPQGDCPSNGHLRAVKHESNEVRPDRKDARKQSKAMMCLETALNEMKLAISNIRTVQMPPAALWHKANLSPPRSYRGNEYLQSRSDWEGRLWPSSSGHNYIDALISPRTRETLAASQHLRRSWDSSSTVDTGAGVPRYHQVNWQSQTVEDLNSSAAMYKEEKIQRWRTSTKLTNSRPSTKDQQRLTHTDPELHGITSSDEEEHDFQPEGVEARSSSARVSNSHWKASMTMNGFAAPSKTISGMPSDHPASSDAFQPCSNTIHTADQPLQLLPPDMGLLEQQHAVIMSFDSTSESTPELSTSTRKSRVKPVNFRASRASKLTFLPQADAMDMADGNLNGCQIAMPVSNSTDGSSGNYIISTNRKSALLTNSGMQRSTEKEMRSVSEAQAYANETIPLPIKGGTGLNEGASVSDTQRVSRSQHNFEHPSDRQLHVVNQPMLSEYSSSKKLYPEKNSTIMEAEHPEAAPNTKQGQGNFATQQSSGYSNLGNLYNVVPNSNLQDESRQYTDISRRLTQEAERTNASVKEPPIGWESPLTLAGLAGPSGISTPGRQQSHTNLSQGMVQIAETSPAISMLPNQVGPYSLPSRRHSQTLKEVKQEWETSNGHSYESSRRNSLLSCVSSADKVGLDALATGQFAVGQNGISTRNNLSLGQSTPNMTQLRNGGVSSDPVVVSNSDFGQAFISRPDLLSKMQTHSVLHQQSSDLKVVSDGSSSQQPPYLLLYPESQNAIDRASMPIPPNSYSLESRVTYADTPSYEKAPATNWELLRSQTGVEGFALAQSDSNNANTYARQNEQALNVSPAVSITSDNMGASKCSEEAAPSVQVSDIAELVNRLVRITAGEGDGANLQDTSLFDRGALNAGSLPAYNSISQEPLSRVWDRQTNLQRVADEATSSYQPPNGVLQDPLSRVWDRQASLPKIVDEATSSYQSPQTNFYQPGVDKVSVQTLPTSQMMVPNLNQDTNLTLQLQGLGLLGGNGSSISVPITLKSADGEVIIIGKERRSSMGILAPQGGEQVQGNLVKNGIQALKAQEERVQDPQQPTSRRPSLTGEMGPLNGEGDAWSLAILKPGTPAQIFKFETQ